MPQPARNTARSSVAERLVSTAEVLFGRHGLDGVSLRQIGNAAGTTNNYAVQYHFGNLAGLMAAIVEKRTPHLEARRAQLLEDLIAAGKQADTRSVMEVVFRPLMEILDSEGERVYARFILALLSSPSGAVEANRLFERLSASRVIDLLQSANPHIPKSTLRERLRLISIMVLTSMFNRLPPHDRPEYDAALIDDALDTASAALSAPIGGSMRAMLKAVEDTP